MAYLYGLRARMPADELTHALRSELYDRPYEEIRFAEHRNTIAPGDVYAPTSSVLKGQCRARPGRTRAPSGVAQARTGAASRSHRV
jgi:hypothetical protein